MKDKMIENYITKITPTDIITFAKENNITLNNLEATHILYHIKKDWKTLLYSSPTKVFEELKPKINQDAYQKGIQLYHQYKQKYQSFL